jgi:hypothetical protein
VRALHHPVQVNQQTEVEMNASISRNLRVALLASTLGASATVLADPMIVADHNAKAGPKQDAVLSCYQAARSDVGDGHGLVFSNRVATERSAQGGHAIVVSGSVWDNGSRVPIEARCEKGASGRLVATVTRVQSGPAIAEASKE